MQDNIHASFAGDVLMIWECRELESTQIFWDYKVKEKCYEYLPITVNETLYFVLPGSNDLVTKSFEADCTHHVKGIFKDKDKYFTNQGPAHVSHVPLDVVWRGKWVPFTFDSPTLFHDQLAGIASDPALIRSYTRHMYLLSQQVERLMSYTADLSLDPSTVYQVLSGSGKAISNVLQGAGNALEHVFTGTTKATSSS